MVIELSALPPIPAAEYVAAIAQHVSSVCVISTALDGERFGLTATAVSSVTADPPRLLVCVNKSGQTHEKIGTAGRFAVNVLAEDQDRVAMIFAGMGGRDVDRFATGDWGVLQSGAPVLRGAAAVFDCRLVETHTQSSHSIFIGEVVASSHQSGADTLLYGARKFRQLRKLFVGPNGGPEEWL